MFTVLFISFLTSVLGSWAIMRFGPKIGFVDIPGERSSHQSVIPKGGGIGILAAFVFCSIELNIPFYFWGMGGILSLVSFWGDKRDIPPKKRLVIHFMCCFVFLVGYFISSQASFLMYVLILPLSVYITGTLNFYNFMDGINGIAGITGVIGFILLAVWGSISGCESRDIVFCLALASACAGFLPFNVPKAKVFMGDIGSVLLGFVFASMVIVMSRDLSSFICCVAFLFPFYVDELCTMAVRIMDGENLAKPHRRHVYQLLANEMGIKHWKISLSFGLVQLIVGCCVMIVKPLGFAALISVLFVFFIISIIFSWYVRQRCKVLNA
jgi:Fuc2NAc and GlcNAc transferase